MTTPSTRPQRSATVQAAQEVLAWSTVQRHEAVDALARFRLALSPSDEALVETVARALWAQHSGGSLNAWDAGYVDKTPWLDAARAAVTAAVQHAEERAR